jgi:hypothetical protein
MVLRLPIEFGQEISPSGRKVRGSASLFRAARCAAVHIDEHDRQAVAAECIGQRAGVFHDFADGVNGREGNEAFLQVDDDKSDLWVNGGNAHESRLPVF